MSLQLLHYILQSSLFNSCSKLRSRALAYTIALLTIVTGATSALSRSPNAFQALLASLDTRAHPLQVRYYEVGGLSVNEIRNALDTQGPRDKLGNRGDALTLWRIKWRWPMDQHAKPIFSMTESHLSVTLTLPRLTTYPQLTPQLQAQWDDFMYHLLLHEIGHLDIAADHYLEVGLSLIHI